MNNKKDFESLIDEALCNIRDDRKVAREFLNEVANLIAKEPEQNKYLSPVAAKHIETLQRSNEQLVKLATMLSRRTPPSNDFKLNEQERERLFDIIEKEKTE